MTEISFNPGNYQIFIFILPDVIIAAAAKFGATPEKPIIVYCNSGIKAAVL